TRASRRARRTRARATTAACTCGWSCRSPTTRAGSATRRGRTRSCRCGRARTTSISAASRSTTAPRTSTSTSRRERGSARAHGRAVEERVVLRGDDARAALGAVLDDLHLAVEGVLEERQAGREPSPHARLPLRL